MKDVFTVKDNTYMLYIYELAYCNNAEDSDYTKCDQGGTVISQFEQCLENHNTHKNVQNKHFNV